ncbi:MDR family oxidoreductase [Notoacmeibacter sp. MSK16QG-6]|uniref:acrylyl-CoA reductase (NADPH) n=1 Tax=Notoacmeibacter sp. MSK16QG-6 TaxID=2957982 RepID=UPI0020A16F3F|nr:MDR family oxidoreductase [Notoacmeibacter sp. MSK16QG-6]MCP1198909.1 oxidoreductase [Notoacmeibacter sp. MSK16QG-6]
MADDFKAILITKEDGEDQKVDVTRIGEDDLMDGDVTVRVEATTVNYKDGLAITGKSPVVRRFPMVPGIDFAGTVETSEHPDWKPGDKVILNGWGTGETHLGAYAEKSRVKGDWLVALPEGLSVKDAMAIGTAGYTAMLSVLGLEDAGSTPDDGPVLVTGATGGVGSVAVSLLSKLGWNVIAATGSPEKRADYLKSLGASEIIDRNELSEKGRPLGKERWAAAVDAVGSHTLANVLAQTKHGGTVTCCGLAQGFDLPTTVMPFILRGITLKGIDSVMAPKPLRERAWQRLATDLDKDRLEAITTEIGFDDLIPYARQIIDSGIQGRVVATF